MKTFYDWLMEKYPQDYTLYDYFCHFVNNKASNETLETFVKLWNEYRNEVKE